jgi:hypothetical protein
MVVSIRLEVMRKVIGERDYRRKGDEGAALPRTENLIFKIYFPQLYLVITYNSSRD